MGRCPQALLGLRQPAQPWLLLCCRRSPRHPATAPRQDTWKSALVDGLAQAIHVSCVFCICLQSAPGPQASSTLFWFCLPFSVFFWFFLPFFPSTPSYTHREANNHSRGFSNIAHLKKGKLFFPSLFNISPCKMYRYIRVYQHTAKNGRMLIYIGF